ncbi:uncharacterized protein LOC132921143 [Rhopalosiphum padi]|uniref:uncharacterized protein LOC132921143 n=1 Tax=Rhopalosiphum padi TaxID=40932 RepID=UPI00298D882F|nr:uncharacterized protein LOC132921143 [Rhopalosiphum padi]
MFELPIYSFSFKQSRCLPGNAIFYFDLSKFPIFRLIEISGIMMISAIFQLGLGIIIFNRITDQETMVKKEMKSSFLSYDIQSDVTQRWNSFQSEFSCCGLYGENSYKAKQLPIPVSCFKNQWTLKQYAEINNCHMGCFELVKKLEEKFLNPVIVLTFFCSFLQMSNAILILNLLRPKPKPRRYNIAYRRTYNTS